MVNQQVVIAGKTSTLKQIQAVVNQGSVLRPLLFLVLINDLPDYVLSEIRLFTDDTILFKIFDDMDQAGNVWAKKWLVTFNPAKTETQLNVSIMTFGRNSQRSYCT